MQCKGLTAPEEMCSGIYGFHLSQLLSSNNGTS